MPLSYEQSIFIGKNCKLYFDRTSHLLNFYDNKFDLCLFSVLHTKELKYKWDRDIESRETNYDIERRKHAIMMNVIPKMKEYLLTNYSEDTIMNVNNPSNCDDIISKYGKCYTISGSAFELYLNMVYKVETEYRWVPVFHLMACFNPKYYSLHNSNDLRIIKITDELVKLLAIEELKEE